ncbi:Gamma-aminobutyric acid (GABA) B receptor [Seminavis robusta]|uniref:Gamma-aminobutyric acid (GABA) B receptor n=1 Tax=Seminavis robusta TaxID=568900 RepID=A0A9N8EGC5_9STRA|nr:Gamma-aminobutyric acid (GABA) B receptor [Seminavis robusta]|eukprot:Sro1055_g236080.1 Gamma-aminobutyric acid (GABA) B receptor (863) ;mRNA; f:28793-31487
MAPSNNVTVSQESGTSNIRYSKDGSRRQGRLLSLMGASNRISEESTGIDTYMYLNIATFLAFKHVQQRNGTVISSLPDRLAGCDFDWTFQTRDTQFSGRKGVEGLLASTTTDSSTNDGQFPFCIVGAIYSSVSYPIAMLGQGYELPQISGSATSSQLEHAPLFSRTIPTNDAEAEAVMLYYQSIGVTHVACLYIKDAWGNSYATGLQNAAHTLGIVYAGFAYDDGNRAGIQSALKKMKESGVRHIFAIMFTWAPVVEVALDFEMIGNPDYSWIGAEMIDWTSGSLEFDRHDPKQLQMAHALRGTGSILLHGGEQSVFEDVMVEFANSPALQREYIQSYPPEERHIYNNYTFLSGVKDYFFQRAFYDATYGLAIAACQTPGLFTGTELYNALINLDYEGVTGRIQFDKSTGTRKPDSVTVRIDNVFWSDDNSDDTFIRLDSTLAVTITQGQVSHLIPWQYYDNTTRVPLSLPALDHDYNLIPLGVQVIGWFFGGAVVFLSLVLVGWTSYNRKLFVVKAGQPMFLSQLCVGTMIMALAVIPMSMQGIEESSRLDLACMAAPWLIFLGFVIAFSALFSKTWRLNKLMNSGMSMRRIQVKPKDVIWPFVTLMTINVGMLLGWSIVSPLKYVRVESLGNVDEYGRIMESHGRCKSQDSKYLWFLVPILFFDFVGVATASYQSYVARNLPTTLSESSYLALGVASLMETLLLGGPIYFMVMDNPTASYLVGSVLLCVINMTILLPIFLPKYLNRGMTPQTGRSMGSAVAGSRAMSQESRQLSSRQLSSENMNLSSKRGFMYISRTPSSRPANGRLSTNSRFSSHSRLSTRSTEMQSVHDRRLSSRQHLSTGLSSREISSTHLHTQPEE